MGRWSVPYPPQAAPLAAGPRWGLCLKERRGCWEAAFITSCTLWCQSQVRQVRSSRPGGSDAGAWHSDPQTGSGILTEHRHPALSPT